MKNIFYILLICLLASTSFATEENNIVYQPVNTAVSWELLPDGSDWAVIYCTSEADLKFGDTRDIRIAKKKAVLRAKAEMAKFLKEKISTEETIEDITKECLNAVSGNGSISEENTRKTVVTTIERIKNQSDAILKGVVVLETKVNSDKKTVIVKVGMSRNSIKIANSVQSAIGKKNNSKKTKKITTKTQSDTTIKRNPMYDEFKEVVQ